MNFTRTVSSPTCAEMGDAPYAATRRTERSGAVSLRPPSKLTLVRRRASPMSPKSPTSPTRAPNLCKEAAVCIG